MNLRSGHVVCSAGAPARGLAALRWHWASRSVSGSRAPRSCTAKVAAAGLPGAGKNTRCTVSAFTHTYYGPYLQDISARLRHGGHLVRSAGAPGAASSRYVCGAV